jgi:hypothetical protein
MICWNKPGIDNPFFDFLTPQEFILTVHFVDFVGVKQVSII